LERLHFLCFPGPVLSRAFLPALSWVAGTRPRKEVWEPVPWGTRPVTVSAVRLAEVAVMEPERGAAYKLVEQQRATGSDGSECRGHSNQVFHTGRRFQHTQLISQNVFQPDGIPAAIQNRLANQTSIVQICS